MLHGARWNCGSDNKQDKSRWKHSLSLPNVVLGASGLRVTGSRTVAGTDQKNNTVNQRDLKIHEKLEHSHPNKTCLYMIPSTETKKKKKNREGVEDCSLNIWPNDSHGQS